MSPARTGITSPNCHVPEVVLKATLKDRAPVTKPSIGPDPVTRLTTHYQTLPKSLKAAGYATGHFGKWHLGAEPYSALEHGFDVDLPHWPGPGPAGSFVAPWKFPDFDPKTPNEHIEDRMASEASAFMEAHRNEPFFVNYWMFSVHAPFNAKKELIEKYRAIVDKKNPQNCPTYAAMVESMDDAVGTLLDTLERLGVADNTIILFTSDNGGNMYNTVDGTTATSNAPLRGGKATMYEGGTRVPLLVCWPGKVAGGSKSDVLMNSCDFYPTLMEMLSLKLASDQRFDGASLVPALQGKPMNRDAIYTFFPHDPPVPEWMPPSVSIHRGDWKLIRLFACGEKGADRWKLFNTRDDIGETTDLVAKHPELVKDLDKRIGEFLHDANAVVPIANPAFDTSKYDATEEGKPGPQHFGGSGKSTKPTSKQIGLWNPSGDCRLSIEAGALVIESEGKDPYASTILKQEAPAGTLTLEFTAVSKSKGDGQIYWQEKGVGPSFAAARSVSVAMVHDGLPHPYRVSISASKPVVAIRIDPSRDAGRIEISKLVLRNGDGSKVQEWDFAKE